MRTFSIQTLGCKVNQYESEQIETLLRGRGLVRIESHDQADLRLINTCSVTIQAASKSRQTIRRTTRLKVLQEKSSSQKFAEPIDTTEPAEANPSPEAIQTLLAPRRGQRTVLTGCWVTSDPEEAASLAGVDAVLGHHHDVAEGLHRLLDRWQSEDHTPARPVMSSLSQVDVKPIVAASFTGTHSLPLLNERQSSHQRGLLKIQDGCDAHCTYCIIPSLRPGLWSKPIIDVVEEARRLVDSGHVELVLTGIFLGAYGQPTALRHRQTDRQKPIADLVERLCSDVQGLRRLRFSSLEPGDLTADLLRVMRSHRQVVPHFHLPLQAGSDVLLRRMNRQYRRDDFLRMIDDVTHAFDRPAITTDIIVGFPGETDAEFAQTLDVVERARFIHVHAFSFSPRPGTAAARWTGDFVRGPIVNERIDRLNARAREHSLEFRRQFIGQSVELLVERPHPPVETASANRSESSAALRHGRSERYFDVQFEDRFATTGDAVTVLIDRVTIDQTSGQRIN